WIARLEREGELVRVNAEVDADLEITEIVDRTVRAGGPALLFENVKGSDRPLLINQFGTERRMCLAFDAPSLDAVAERVSDVLEMQPPEGLVAKVRGLQKLKSIADSRPRTVRRGACQEIVLTGDDTGYYTPPEPFPVFRLTAVTMRRDAIYPSIVFGKPPAEDAWLGKATERIFLPAVKMTVPEIVDYDLPVAGAFHNCCIVSVRKAYP